jgi:alkanesulfonate monooxygenase SsuD/methylene tetrahydromethanopterin reductase-like flavin-dependent oxidoreductase (luciferase family)
LRALWSADGSQFAGHFYSTAGIDLDPKPLQRPTPPIWIGSWGSDVGLRRVARLGNGWLASAYNTTPKQFSMGLDKLRDQLKKLNKDPESFPNALVTMFMYIAEDRAEADRVLSEIFAVMLKRPVDQLRERLLVGSPETSAEKLVPYQMAGVQRVFLWPIAAELDQLAIFRNKVTPLVDA